MISEGIIGGIHKDGCEEIIFSLLTSVGAIGYLLSSAIGGILTEILDINNNSLSEGDFSGVKKLTIILSIVRLIPLSLIFFLPDAAVKLSQSSEDGESRVFGGKIYIFFLLGGVTFTVVCDYFLLFA